MKNIFLLLLLVSFIGTTQAQKCKATAVPVQVKDAFHKEYPTHKKCYWGKDSSNYQVSFFTGKAPVAVTYDATGNRIITEKQVPVEELPQGITEYVQKNYPGEIYKNVVQVTDAKGIITYEVQVKNMALEFDAKGNYLESLTCEG